MKTSMLALLAGWAFSGGYPKIPADQLICNLDEAIQRRFAAPPQELGLSRVAIPRSLGRHFQPTPTAATDFRPETPSEQSLIRALEAGAVNTGFYVFGAAITRSAPQLRDFRALKGPAVVTPGTVRPAWYPPLAPKASSPDALPDWEAVYPIARQAMTEFEAGATNFQTSAGIWRVLARPVPASAASCVGCHNNSLIGRAAHPIALHDAIGGVLYLYK